MNKSLEALIQGLEDQASKGANASDHDVLRALRIEEAQSEVSRYLDQQYSVTECVRVYFTRNPEWVEILVRLAPPPGAAVLRPPRILITFDGTNGQLISVSREFGETQTLRAQNETLLPFALATPSYTEAVRTYDDDPNLLETNARRQAYFQNLAPELVAGSTTSYQTSSQTGYQTAEQTSYSTSGVTTPNDNDTRTDYRSDVRTDYRTDTTTDTRTDD